MMTEKRDEGSHGPENLRAVHERRLAERNRALEHWSKLDRRVADIRLAVFCAGIVLAVLVYRGWGFERVVAGSCRARSSSPSCSRTSRSGGRPIGQGGPSSSIPADWPGSMAGGPVWG